MGTLIFALVLGAVSLACFVISILQFLNKGPLFNNAYIYAPASERETMYKKPYYLQSGVVFALVGGIFAVNAVNFMLHTNWLFFVVIGLVVITFTYAIVSSVIIEKNSKKTDN